MVQNGYKCRQVIIDSFLIPPWICNLREHKSRGTHELQRKVCIYTHVVITHGHLWCALCTNCNLRKMRMSANWHTCAYKMHTCAYKLHTCARIFSASYNLHLCTYFIFSSFCEGGVIYNCCWCNCVRIFCNSTQISAKASVMNRV